MNMFDQRPRLRTIRTIIVVLALYGLTVLIEVIGSKEGLSIRLLGKCALILIRELALNWVGTSR